MKLLAFPLIVMIFIAYEVFTIYLSFWYLSMTVMVCVEHLLSKPEYVII